MKADRTLVAELASFALSRKDDRNWACGHLLAAAAEVLGNRAAADQFLKSACETRPIRPGKH